MRHTAHTTVHTAHVHGDRYNPCSLAPRPWSNEPRLASNRTEHGITRLVRLETTYERRNRRCARYCTSYTKAPLQHQLSCSTTGKSSVCEVVCCVRITAADPVCHVMLATSAVRHRDPTPLAVNNFPEAHNHPSHSPTSCSRLAWVHTTTGGNANRLGPREGAS